MAKVATTNSKVTLQTKVFSSSKVYYEGEADRISTVNDVGPFDVLPGHHNFISLLEKGNLQVILNEQKAYDSKINGGLMHVTKNTVQIFLDI